MNEYVHTVFLVRFILDVGGQLAAALGSEMALSIFRYSVYYLILGSINHTVSHLALSQVALLRTYSTSVLGYFTLSRGQLSSAQPSPA